MEEEEIGFPPVARVNICRRADERSSNWLLRLWQADRGILWPAFIHGLYCEKEKTGLLPRRQKKAFVFFNFTISAETVIFVTLKQESNQIKKIKDRSWPKKLLKLR